MAATILKPILKYTAGLAGLIVVTVAGYIAFLALTYIDETVIVGTSYGYTIGQSKRDTFSTVREQFDAEKITGVNVSEPFESFEPEESHWILLEANDRWTLFA
ncbi:MAG: hypothetical protein ACR2QW_14275, partial [bacterium]